MPYAKHHRKEKEGLRNIRRKLNNEFDKYYNTKNNPNWNKGKNNPNWKGGITSEIKNIRNSMEYKIWRTMVYRRDSWTCQTCGKMGCINAHHIKSFADYPELRFAIDNGVTLCLECHHLCHNLTKSGRLKKWKK